MLKHVVVVAVAAAQLRMEEFNLNPVSLSALLSLFIIILIWSINRVFLKPAGGAKLPPSPLKLPIIGHLHQIGSLPHKNLHCMARKHGPLMLLHFGSVPVLIASSADSAREIMKTHDLNFASRPPYKAFKKLMYGCKDVATAPYSEYWRKTKSIVVLQLLSGKRVQSFRSIREEEIALLLKKIGESLRPVNLSSMFAQFTSDGVGRSAFGRRYSESENGKKFLRVMLQMMELLGRVNIGDFIPWLDWINRVNGFDESLDRTAKEMDDVLESMIQERMETNQNEKIGENILDILLEIYKGNTADASIDRDSLKAVILDVFVGGTDTISITLEWAMTELLRHPAVMEKLQREVRGIVGQKHNITDDDLNKMQYMKAVIKEVLRHHPPVPLLVPRISNKDVQIKGFEVSAGTVVMINAWAIGRDPNLWDEPEKFMPERFLNSSIDFISHDFKLVPFGAGRRGCPGIAFAVANIELVLANLMQKFDWKLPDGVEAKDVDMSESPGLTVHKDEPVLAVASQCKELGSIL